MAAIELYTPQGAEMVSGMIYASDEQGYNNVKHCDTSCKSAMKMPLLLLQLQSTLSWVNGGARVT